MYIQRFQSVTHTSAGLTDGVDKSRNMQCLSDAVKTVIIPQVLFTLLPHPSNWLLFAQEGVTTATKSFVLSTL